MFVEEIMPICSSFMVNVSLKITHFKLQPYFQRNNYFPAGVNYHRPYKLNQIAVTFDKVIHFGMQLNDLVMYFINRSTPIGT